MAVADELKKRNPGFDGQVKPTVENGVVVGLEFITDQVTDLAAGAGAGGAANAEVWRQRG